MKATTLTCFLLALLLAACSSDHAKDGSPPAEPECIVDNFRSPDSFDCPNEIELPEALAAQLPLMQYIVSKNDQNQMAELSEDTVSAMGPVLQYLAEGDNNRSYEFAHFLLLFSKADWLYEKRRPAEAQLYLRQALGLMEEQQSQWQDTCMWAIQGALLNRASLIYTELDERENGLAYTLAAAELYKKTGLHGQRAVAYANIGYALLSAGEPGAALEAFRKAICIYDNLPQLHALDSTNLAWLHNIRAQTYSLFADSLELRARFAGARAFREKSLHLYKSNLSVAAAPFQPGEYEKYLLHTSFNIADMYGRAPHPAADSIRQYAYRARTYLQPDDEAKAFYESIIIRHLAQADAIEGKREEALEKIGRALRLSIRRHDSEGNPLYWKKQAHLDLLLAKANIFRQFAEQSRDDPDLFEQSLRAYLRAFTFLEELRRPLGTDASPESILKPRMKHYSDAFAVAARLHRLKPRREHLEAAFEILERSKGFTLEQSIFRKLEELEKSSPGPAYLQRELGYRRRIQSLEAELADGGGEGVAEALRKERERFSRFIDTLREDSSARAFYDNRLREELPLIAEVQQEVLNDSSAVISYLLGNRRLWALLIRQNEVLIAGTDIDSSFFPLLEDYQNSIREEREYSFYVSRAKGLYDKAVRMLEPHLAGISQLIIIPDKQLARAPFGPLLSDAPEETVAYSELPYLTGRYAIAYHSSLSSFISSRKLEQLRPVAPMAFGGFLSNRPNPEAGISSCGHFELQALNVQVKDTYRTYYSRHSVPPYERASEADFIREAENFDLLQLSLHGCADSRATRSFYLEFYPASPEADGKLSLPEIYNLNLRARLAILSNCQTAEGNYIYGEGVMSISRAFLYAGCTRLMATANPVPGPATADILGSFYQAMEEDGLPPQQALAEAQRRYFRQGNVHPRTWGNLLYVGDIRPLQKPER